MKIRLPKKLALGVLLVVGALVGSLLGAGVAFADDIFMDLASGYQYKYAYHYDSFSNLSWDWFQRNYVYRSDDSTYVALYEDDPYGTYYYEGWSNAPDDIEFGPLYIADEENHHNVYYNSITGFESRDVDGVNWFGQGTSWSYGSLNSNNNYVDMWQYVWYWPPSSPLTTVDIALTSFYTGIGTRR